MDIQMDEVQLMEALVEEIHILLNTSAGNQRDLQSGTFPKIRAQCLDVFQAIPKCMLTILHKSYVMLLLQFGMYDLIFDDISLPITSCHSSVLSSDILLFFYYLGLAQIKMERYTDARESILCLLTIPSVEYSVISLAACRKLCLLDLIVYGKLIPLPEWIVMRNPLCGCVWDDVRNGTLRAASTAESSDADVFDQTSVSMQIHSEIARVYVSSNDHRDLVSLIEAHEDYLSAAKDFGLSKRVVVAKCCQSLREMSKCYSTIAISDVFQQLNIGDIEELKRVLYAFNSDFPLSAALEKDYLIFSGVDSVPSRGRDLEFIQRLMCSLQSRSESDLQSLRGTRLQP
jgi:hypothetical protein